MVEWVIVHPSINRSDIIDKFVSIKEDVCESFCGALNDVSDDICPGAGDVHVSNFLAELFSNITFNIDVTKGKSETKFIEYYEGLAGKLKGGGGKEHYMYATKDRTGGGWIVEIRPPNLDDFNAKIQELQGPDFYPITSPLGKSHARTKKAAENNAFKEAFNILLEHGIDGEWVERVKEYIIIERIGRSLYDEAFRIAENMKIADMDKIQKLKFSKPRGMNISNAKVMTLIGVDKNKRSVNLKVATYYNEEADEFLEKKIVELFIKDAKISRL
jgi:hypothetical protein